MALTIVQFRCLIDNYGVLLHDGASGATAAIDAPHADTIAAELHRRSWRLDTILVTHRHGDHTAGIPALKAEFGCTVVAPAEDAAEIPDVDRVVGNGAGVECAGRTAEVIATPGHTPGHVAYWLAADETVFVGDTLFTMGCGRVPDGWAHAMWTSLDCLRRLPDATGIYCGHDYAAANARFALSVEPDNADLAGRAAEAVARAGTGGLTPPTRVALERRTNPFLRVDEPAIRQRLGLASAAPAEVFAELRRRKDRF